MAKKTSQLARQSLAVQETLAELYIEVLRNFAPRSTERLLNSAVELMEAHRELIAERIAQLEAARKKLAGSAPTARRKIVVRQRRVARPKRTAA